MFYVTKYFLIIAVEVTVLLIVSLRQVTSLEISIMGWGWGAMKKFFGKAKELAFLL